MKAKYWTEKHYQALHKAKTFPELLVIAYEILDSISVPVGLVSGPISTGGLGSIAENLKVFEEAITTLENKGEHVFNQLPFEDKFLEMSQSYKGYFTPILEEFFLPIFKSGKIAKIWFMPGWKTSTGAKWEYEQADKLGIERCFDFL